MPHPTTIDGKYRIVRALGHGGMGAVYEAEHSATGRRVAVKVILTAAADPTPDAIARFEREARALGAIDSPHIVHVFDAGRDSQTGNPFLVMERLSGEDLHTAIRRHGPLPLLVALRIAAQACAGLHKAHEAGIVHRDIKPANIFLARGDAGAITVKILDFGIAKFTADAVLGGASAAGSLTNSGSIIGSPLYMSPEQIKGKKTLDRRTDIWSIGMVLYEALAGRTAFAHLDTVGELLVAIGSENPRPIQIVAPWIPPDVAGLVHRALSRDPNARFTTAAEMLAAIERIAPDGEKLVADAIVGLSKTDKERVEPRHASTNELLGAFASTGEDVLGAILEGNTHSGASKTGGSFTRSRPGATRPPSRRRSVALGLAGILVAAASAGIFVAARRAPASDAAKEALTEAKPPIVAPALPETTATAAAEIPAPKAATSDSAPAPVKSAESPISSATAPPRAAARAAAPIRAAAPLPSASAPAPAAPAPSAAAPVPSAALPLYSRD